jgi:hypothetical protein
MFDPVKQAAQGNIADEHDSQQSNVRRGLLLIRCNVEVVLVVKIKFIDQFYDDGAQHYNQSRKDRPHQFSTRR